MAVAFLTNDIHAPLFDGGAFVPGGCAYYRCYLPMYALGRDACMGFPAWTGERGFGVRTGPKKARFGFDTVVLKLMMERWVPEQIRRAQKLGQRVIVDVDDLYDDLDPSNAAHAETSAENNKVRNREHYAESIALADTITVSTPYLQEHYSKTHKDVRLIRNGVYPQQFVMRKVRTDQRVVGWVGATPYRSNDLEMLRSWLPDFLEAHDAMFQHSGHTDERASFAEIVGVPEGRMIVMPMVPIDLYSALFDFDIGIVPLTDIPFNRAKSTIKGLEYTAAGIPWVASAVGEYVDLARRGIGRIAASDGDWVAHMEELLLDVAQRKEDRQMNFGGLPSQTIHARSGEWQEVMYRQREKVTARPFGKVVQNLGAGFWSTL